jgi:hypothetical protein
VVWPVPEGLKRVRGHLPHLQKEFGLFDRSRMRSNSSRKPDSKEPFGSISVMTAVSDDHISDASEEPLDERFMISAYFGHDSQIHNSTGRECHHGQFIFGSPLCFMSARCFTA